MGHMLFILTFGIAIFCAVALLLAPMLSEPSAETQRILEVAGPGKAIQHVIHASTLVEDTFTRLSRILQLRLGFKRSSALDARLEKAGVRSAGSADRFFAAQFLTPLIAAFAASFIPSNTLFMVLLLGALGFILPDMWLTRRTSQRRKQIQRGMPDTLDLLVICVDAGMGLDQALLRVTDELKRSHPCVYEELLQVNLEQRAGRPRLETWQTLATRTEVPELHGFVSMLVQTDRFGTPILKALKDYAEEIRGKRQQRAEEAAAKTKIKITFPLVFCIFPCIFLVLLAPALLGIMDGLKQIGK